MTKKTVFVLALFFLVSLAYAVPCVDNTDCTPPEFCVAGECFWYGSGMQSDSDTSMADVPECTVDSDCDWGFCVEGECIYAQCVVDEHCGPDAFCMGGTCMYSASSSSESSGDDGDSGLSGGLDDVTIGDDDFDSGGLDDILLEPLIEPEEIIDCCDIIDQYLPSQMFYDLNAEEKTVTITLFAENSSDSVNPKKPVANAPVGIYIKEAEKEGEVPYTELIGDLYTDSNGKLTFDFSAYVVNINVPITFTFIYCPYECACMQCWQSFDVDMTLFGFDNESVLFPSIKLHEQSPEYVLPTSVSVTYSPPLGGIGTPAFCFPLVLIFALLAGAMYVTGRNPFVGFDLSAPRMKKHFRYGARGRGWMFDATSVGFAGARVVSYAKKGGVKGETKRSKEIITKGFGNILKGKIGEGLATLAGIRGRKKKGAEGSAAAAKAGGEISGGQAVSGLSSVAAGLSLGKKISKFADSMNRESLLKAKGAGVGFVSALTAVLLAAWDRTIFGQITNAYGLSVSSLIGSLVMKGNAEKFKEFLKGKAVFINGVGLVDKNGNIFEKGKDGKLVNTGRRISGEDQKLMFMGGISAFASAYANVTAKEAHKITAKLKHIHLLKNIDFVAANSGAKAKKQLAELVEARQKIKEIKAKMEKLRVPMHPKIGRDHPLRVELKNLEQRKTQLETVLKIPQITAKLTPYSRDGLDAKEFVINGKTYHVGTALTSDGPGRTGMKFVISTPELDEKNREYLVAKSVNLGSLDTDTRTKLIAAIRADLSTFNPKTAAAVTGAKGYTSNTGLFVGAHIIPPNRPPSKDDQRHLAPPEMELKLSYVQITNPKGAVIHAGRQDLSALDMTAIANVGKALGISVLPPAIAGVPYTPTPQEQIQSKYVLPSLGTGLLYTPEERAKEMKNLSTTLHNVNNTLRIAGNLEQVASMTPDSIGTFMRAIGVTTSALDTSLGTAMLKSDAKLQLTHESKMNELNAKLKGELKIEKGPINQKLEPIIEKKSSEIAEQKANIAGFQSRMETILKAQANSLEDVMRTEVMQNLMNEQKKKSDDNAKQWDEAYRKIDSMKDERKRNQELARLYNTSTELPKIGGSPQFTDSYDSSLRTEKMTPDTLSAVTNIFDLSRKYKIPAPFDAPASGPEPVSIGRSEINSVLLGGNIGERKIKRENALLNTSNENIIGFSTLMQRELQRNEVGRAYDVSHEGKTVKMSLLDIALHVPDQLQSVKQKIERTDTAQRRMETVRYDEILSRTQNPTTIKNAYEEFKRTELKGGRDVKGASDTDEQKSQFKRAYENYTTNPKDELARQQFAYSVVKHLPESVRHYFTGEPRADTSAPKTPPPAPKLVQKPAPKQPKTLDIPPPPDYASQLKLGGKTTKSTYTLKQPKKAETPKPKRPESVTPVAKKKKKPGDKKG